MTVPDKLKTVRKLSFAQNEKQRSKKTIAAPRTKKEVQMNNDSHAQWRYRKQMQKGKATPVIIARDCYFIGTAYTEFWPWLDSTVSCKTFIIFGIAFFIDRL